MIFPLRLFVLHLVGLCSCLSNGLAEGLRVREAIPLDQIGAAAEKHLVGRGTCLTACAHGAEMQVSLQKLKARATSEGLWVESTEQPAKPAGIRVRSVHLGKETSLAQAGEVQMEDDVVRWVRPHVVEEYRVSADGIRQDFIVVHKPSEPGPLRLSLGIDGARVDQADQGVLLTLKVGGNGLPDAWEILKFGTTVNRGPSDDPDGDGLANLTEYAFGLEPLQSDPGGMPNFQLQSGYLTVTINKKPGVAYEAESSGDLLSFSPLTTYKLFEDATTLTFIDIFSTAEANRRFMRLKVVGGQ